MFVLRRTRTFSSITNKSNIDFLHKPDFRPRRIILLRHGESLGNVDETAYATTADWRIPITTLGQEQAVEAGRNLREKISEDDAKVIFYHSPYLRTRQTLDELLPYFSDSEILSCLEEPRICEQQIGNFQNVQDILDAKKERSKFGRFFYRFPQGEAGLDVYNRVSSFIPTLVRDLDRHRRSGIDMDNVNVVIVTHGLALRLILMRWFQWSVDCFEESQNPDNCELVTMNKKKDHEGHAWMELEEEDRRSLCLPGDCAVPRNVHLHRMKGDFKPGQ
jgi:broad specificity phosphatase PhoE